MSGHLRSEGGAYRRLAIPRAVQYIVQMARDPKELHRLADELASLTSEERAEVIIEVKRRKEFKPMPRDFKPPKLGAGGTWVGGSLRREELYGDDRR